MQYAETSPFCLKLQIYLKYKFTVEEGNRLPLFLMFDLSKVSLHFSWVRKKMYKTIRTVLEKVLIIFNADSFLTPKYELLFFFT